MNRSTFMIIAAIIALVFGVGFLLVPAQVMAMYGTTLDVPGMFIGRYFGSALLGVGLLTWLARKAQGDNEALRAIILGNFIFTVAGTVVAVLDKFTGGGNAMVWSTVLIFFLLAIGFGYYQFKKK